jgi:2-polyprenyl-3-methyl-5-hydroxy-6-metoxy-1,4-benzoquinol methylase
MVREEGSVRADFDRIARLMAEEPEHPERYESFVLAQIPVGDARVLEVGCGAGRLARAIAARGASVTAIDASPEMIGLARERSPNDPRIDFIYGDFSVQDLGSEPYDCVVSVATLHHLAAEPALVKMEGLVRPGGVVVIHDLRAPEGLGDWIGSGLAAIPNGDAVWWLRSHLRQRHAVRHAWREHGSHDSYLTMAGVHALFATALPGARIHRHPLWRYTVVWTRAQI